MRLSKLLVLIMLVIRTTFKYHAAVYEARMLQPPHDGASPRVELSKTGFETPLDFLS